MTVYRRPKTLLQRRFFVTVRSHSICSFLLGLIVIGIGIWLVSWDARFSQVSRYGYLHLAWLTLVYGLGILIHAFLGAIGVKFVRRRLIIWYMRLSFALLIILVTTGMVTMLFRYKVSRRLHEELQHGIRTRFYVDRDPYETFTHSVDWIQFYMSCCGVDSYKDWFGSKFQVQFNELPVSCCNEDVRDYPCGRGGIHNIFLDGCYVKIAAVFHRDLSVIIWILMLAGIFQVFNIAMAFMLLRKPQWRDPDNDQLLEKSRQGPDTDVG